MFTFFVLSALLAFSQVGAYCDDDIPQYNYFAIVPYVARPGQLWNTLEAFKEQIVPQMEEQIGFVDIRIGFNIGENSVVAMYEFTNKYTWIEATKSLNPVALLPLIKTKLGDINWDIYSIEEEEMYSTQMPEMDE